MVSRKKARGKARKAAKMAKAEAEAEEEHVAVKHISLARLKDKDKCSHGWSHDEYANDHDCYKLINDVLKGFQFHRAGNNFMSAAHEATFKYPEILKDTAKLGWIASAFVSIGTELLTEEYDDCICAYSLCYSDWILQYVAYMHKKSVPGIYEARLRELVHADERRLIGYLKKRIPCSCLNSTYNAIKHLPKNGRCCSDSCSLPDRKIKLSKMWSCEACRRQHYCSKSAKRRIGRIIERSVQFGGSGRYWRCVIIK